MFDYLNWRICAFLLYLLSHPRAPETRPKPASADVGAEMHPWVYLWVGFFQPRGFARGRVFTKPAPASAGAIPNCVASARWLLRRSPPASVGMDGQSTASAGVERQSSTYGQNILTLF